MPKKVIHLITLMLLCVMSVLFQSQAVAAASANPAPLVEKIVQAYGGRTALERIKVVKHVGTIQSYRLGKTGSLERLFVLPGKLRVTMNYSNGPREQRITTPEGAWRDGQPATAPMHTAMALQAARFRLPMLLTEYPVTVLAEDEASVQLGVKLTPTNSLEIVVDRQSWRIVRSVGRMLMGAMSMAFTADYSDFRKVDGVLFAHKEELTAMGRPTGIAVLERIVLNSKISNEDFHP